MSRGISVGSDLNRRLPKEVRNKVVRVTIDYDRVVRTATGSIVLADVVSAQSTKTFGNFSARMAGTPHDRRLWVNSTLAGDFYYSAIDAAMYRKTFACYFTQFTTTKRNDAVSKLNGDFQHGEFAGCTFTNTSLEGNFARASFSGHAVDGSIDDELNCVTRDEYCCVFSKGSSLDGNFKHASFRSCKFKQVNFNGDFEKADFTGASIKRSCLDSLAECGALSSEVALSDCYVTSHQAMVRLITSAVDIDTAMDWSHDGCVGNQAGYHLLQQLYRQLFDHVPEAKREAFAHHFTQQIMASTDFADLIDRMRALPAPALSRRESLFRSPYAAAHTRMTAFVIAVGDRIDRPAVELEGGAAGAGHR